MIEISTNKHLPLPQDVQKAVEATNIAEKIQRIGKDNDLHLDQIGALSDTIDSMLSGEIHPEELVDAIEERLHIDMQKAIAITADVNLDILIPIRERLIQGQNTQQTTGETPQSAPIDPVGTKESILSEIENPTPTIHPISAADQTIPGPAIPKEILNDFVGTKLSETTSIPSEKASVSAPQAPVAPEKPKGYATDPYREPLA